MDRKYEYYVVGVAEEFVKKSKEEVSVIADNEYFANKLKQSYKDEKIKIDAKKITLNLISELLKKRPIILHIDDNFLGDYSHVSHFIVLEKATKTKFLIHDPYYGKKSFVSQKKIINAVQSLKKHVKMCPLIFYI
jgi:ABC-type bacteriocin/lantibiotic exporter with double-glycine peptidase domain